MRRNKRIKETPHAVIEMGEITFILVHELIVKKKNTFIHEDVRYVHGAVRC